jgi:sRNA-binding protein
MPKDILDIKKRQELWRSEHIPDIYTMLLTLSHKFPKAFFIDDKKMKPLKICIHEDIKIALGVKNQYDPDSRQQKRLIRSALYLYTSAPGYLLKLSKQLYRINLHGKKIERVTASQALIAKAQLEAFKLSLKNS